MIPTIFSAGGPSSLLVAAQDPANPRANRGREDVTNVGQIRLILRSVEE